MKYLVDTDSLHVFLYFFFMLPPIFLSAVFIPNDKRLSSLFEYSVE